MKTLFNFIQQRIDILFIIALASTIMLMPLASNISIPYDLDYISHLSAISQAKLALAQGQVPLRFSPTDHEGWLYPLFQFYSPTSYMVSGLIYQWLTPSNPYIAFKVTLWCALFISGIYMYKLSNWLVQFRPAAILASVAYITTPYTIILVSHIGAFNECIAVSLLPVVLYYTFQNYYHPKQINNYLFTGAAWYLLATVHLLTFLSTSFVVAAFLLYLTVKNPKHWVNLISAGLAYAFGCILAMWFIAPIVLLSKYLNINNTFTNSDFFYAHTPSLTDLLGPNTLFDPILGYTYNLIDSISLIHPNIGFPILIAVGVCCCLFFTRAIKANNLALNWLLPLITLFFIIFIIVWSPINFWVWLPQPFRVLQYSWRLLSQLAWIGSLLLAYAIAWSCHFQLSRIQTYTGIILLIFCSATGLFLHEDKIRDYDGLINTLMQDNAYLIDATKFTRSIFLVDSILIDSSQFNDKLSLNAVKPINIPTKWLRSAAAPFISIEGIVPKNIPPSSTISVSINGSVKAIHALKPGPLYWEIPIRRNEKLSSPVSVTLKSQNHQNVAVPLFWSAPTHKNDKSPSSISIKFKLNKNMNVNVPLKRIIFGGILKSSDVINPNQVQSHCKMIGNINECNINVPQSVKIVELPLYYYPQLLNITVNGTTVPYISLYYRNEVITGIIPEAGKLNTIRIQFRGLLWANYLSGVSWQLWLLLLSYLILRRVFYSK